MQVDGASIASLADSNRGEPADLNGMARESSSPEALDLASLVDRCMGNLDLVERILEKFQTQIESDLDELEAVLNEQQQEHIARVAHRIKGASANVSAGKLQQVASEIEQLGREARVAEIAPRLEQLRSEWARYLDCRATLSLAHLP